MYAFTEITDHFRFLFIRPTHDFNSLYFNEMAHNFSKSGAIGPFVYFAFPISETIKLIN